MNNNIHLQRYLFFSSLLISLLLTVQIKAQSGDYRFYHRNIYDGLSQNDVRCLFKDTKGFLWVGTSSGLNKYDGYKFKQFKRSSSDTNTLSNNYITDITEDKQGNIWVGTLLGLNKYSYRTNKFTRYLENYRDTIKLISHYVTDILCDKSGKIWIIGRDGGLSLYEQKFDGFIRLSDKKVIPSYNLEQIVEDKNGVLWMTDNSGWLISYKPATGKVQSYKIPVTVKDEKIYKLIYDSKDVLWIYSNKEIFRFTVVQKKYTKIDFSALGLDGCIISGIQQDLDGNYWFISDNNGVVITDSSLHPISHLKHNIYDPGSILYNSIITIYIDKDNTVWLGFSMNGFSFYDPSMKKFALYRNIPHQSGSLSDNNVNCIFQDSQQQLWIGTGSGLNSFSAANQSFKRELYKSLNGKTITCLAEDNEKNIWIGTYMYGLYVYNLESKRLLVFNNNPGDSNSVGTNKIWSLYKDRNGTMWIGTSGAGLNRYNPVNKTFIRYKIKDWMMSADYIYSIYEDSKNNFWLCTNFGLILLDRKTGNFRNYIHQYTPSLSEDHIQCIFEDSQNHLWVGTLEGLNLFDYDEQIFKAFTIENGLAGNTIFSILEDKAQNLWVSTNNGISKVKVHYTDKIDDITIKVYNYNENDGLQGREFIMNSAYKSVNGMMYFGGWNGLNAFNPTTIHKDKTGLRIAITNIMLFNNNISVGEEINGHVILRQDLSETKEIVLKYRQNHFSLEFSALNFINSGSIYYSYMLEGFNKQWIKTSIDNRVATYTNLNPGHYIFHVKVLNSDGSWNNKEAILKIRILPPWYLTGLALITYVILFLFGLFLLRFFILRRERLKNLIKEERLNAQRQNELNEIKTNFFTNISHEFRTPLTLIMNPAKNLIKASSHNDEQRKQLENIYHNAQKLLDLTNQIMDLQKLDAGKLQLHIEKADIVEYCLGIVSSFESVCSNKNNTIRFISGHRSADAFFDKDKTGKILSNLLSNSIKFCYQNSTIDVKIDIANNTFFLSVEDKGIGIPREQIDQIFKRYYQASSNNRMAGTGIGLAYVKELIDFMNGKVNIESIENESTKVSISFPVSELEIINNSELITTIPKIGKSKNYKIFDAGSFIDDDPGKKSILIVEDNDELRDFIANLFKTDYHVHLARDGQEGMQAAFHIVPDIIISDIMMPNTDGLELSLKLKQDVRSSHIPIILLTAKDTPQSSLEGYKTGADDYIVKPFDNELLLLKVRNILTTREAARKQFDFRSVLTMDNLKLGDTDKEFMKKCFSVIENNLDNSEFSVEKLAGEVGFSHRNFYRKIYAITGETPAGLIRVYRLNFARQLIQNTNMRVFEIAGAVGYEDVKRFSQAFKKQFGFPPSGSVNNK